MKIGLVIYGELEKESGGYLYDRRLVQHLKRSSFEVDVISLDKEEDDLSNIKNNFLDTYKMKLERYDLLLQDELCFLSLFELNDRLKEDIEIVSIVHHLSCEAERDKEKRKMWRYFEKSYLESVDRFILNSEPTYSSVEDLDGKVDGVTAPPGKDHLDVTLGDEVTNEEMEILFVGNFTPTKCIDVILQAVRRLEDVKLRLVGDVEWDEEYGEKIKKMIGEMEKGKVEVLGRVDKNRLKKEYRRADVFLLPSKYEGYGISMIEALGHHIPVIATARGGPKEIIEDGKEGFLVEPENVDELRTKLKYLRDNSVERKEMGENARARYEELPTWEESMEKVKEFLSKE